jgi:hypothetical protein
VNMADGLKHGFLKKYFFLTLASSKKNFFN